MVEIREYRLEDSSQYGHVLPENMHLWGGYTMLKYGVVIGYAGVCADKNGAYLWFHMMSYAEKNPYVMHRLALKTIKEVKADGFTCIYASCQRNINGAAKWLERLGLKPTDKVDDEGRRVYTWQ